YLGATFSNVPIVPGDTFTRPSAGGGGFGDPMERDIDAVLEDVIDGYVSLERARKDYGVVIQEIDAELDQFEVDYHATETTREDIRRNRAQWLQESPQEVARWYLDGKIDVHDAVRQYGVILDWGTAELFSKTTEQYRESMQKRSATYW